MCPSNLEALAALGCFERVIACEDSSDWPPGVEALERLGPDLGPDLDRVAALAPDLVVSSLSVPGMERVVTGLRARGLDQVVLAPRGVADVLAELERLAALLGVEERAATVVAELRAEVERLTCEAAAFVQAGGPARVYLEWWPRPMFTPGRDCYSNELIRLAGGVNVFAERPGSSLEIDAAELLAADPELCFVSWCGVDAAKLDPRKLIERPGLERLGAARREAVFALDERYAGRPGPRMLEAARRMAAAIRDARR
nr:helical backbone metal receptor [Pseudenhygromyxa sp. WMMC2535]